MILSLKNEEMKSAGGAGRCEIKRVWREEELVDVNVVGASAEGLEQSGGLKGEEPDERALVAGGGQKRGPAVDVDATEVGLVGLDAH